ncbi:hypothetical protein BGZ54_004456, partial [Gamsiella multidivaricata]
MNAVGARAWRSAKKKWEQETRKAAEKGKDVSQRTPPTFKEAGRDVMWEALEVTFRGVREIRRAEAATEAEEGFEGVEWAVQD